MTITEYQIEAKRTCPNLGDDKKDITHMYLGIMTELGETLDIFKKYIAYGKEIDYVNLQEEFCGDLPWYLANLMTFEDYTLKSEPKKVKNNYSNLSLEEISWKICSLMQAILSGDYDYYEAIWQEIYDISVALNLDFYRGLENNINKLKARYPEGFTQDKALNRNLDIERKELEK